MKMKEKQKKRKAYEPKLTQEELMDSSTFKRFLASIDNILENLEDVDFTAMGKYQSWLAFKLSLSAKIKCEFINPNTPNSSYSIVILFDVFFNMMCSLCVF